MEMTDKHFNFARPAAAVCYSKVGLEDMLKAAKLLCKREDFVQLFDYSSKIVPRLMPAYINAVLRYREGSAISSSIGIEMLLLLCGSTDIRKAIKECGAKEGKNFIVFASTSALLGRFTKASGMKVIRSVKLDIDFEEASAVARVMH